jgi:UDP-N-acetylglucosamine--N-acetylmuramyl-(pentapeptide) pyrophosphoryl-undecaprenol N-acetylglucosamine transferase
MPKTLMIGGGGTGGHIYPAIAIAQEFMARGGDRRVIFVGTPYGLEKTIVPKAGFPLEFISVGALKGKGPVDLLRNLARIPGGVIQAWRIIGNRRPDVVLGVGGYSSGPVLVAAKLRGVPTAIHEQNAYPGLANRWLAPLVKAVAVAFADAGPRLKRPDAVVTGNPIRKEFFSRGGQPASAVRDSGGPLSSTGKQRLLIFGGSQGSHVLNEAMSGALLFLAPLRDRLEIVHQTGPKEVESVKQAYRASAFAGARVVPYLDPIADEIAAASFVVCRAGAMSIGDVAAVGRAAILVPFAASADNHQEFNARMVERAGGAVVITEAELTPERLASAITALAADPARATQMGAAAHTLVSEDATKKIVDLLEKIDRSE